MNIIDKMCEPTRFDVQPLYTICKVNNDNNLYSYYIQLGSDEINWQPIHYLLNCIFSEKFYIHEDFVNELIALYQDKTRSFDTLTTVLRSQER